jgi:polyhydroxyalkanoate synthesis repressor PhaR
MEETMRLIKRYKNRRLYDTETKKMVTIEDLSAMVKADEEFKVMDNVSRRDITGEILTTILRSEVKSWKDLKDSGKLIKELISKKGAGAASLLRKTALAGLGVISLDRKRAEEIIDELINKGELTSSKRGEALKNLLGRADAHSKKFVSESRKVLDRAGGESRRLFNVAQEQINAGLEKLRSENKREIEELSRKVDSLEAALKRIEEKLNSSS